VSAPPDGSEHARALRLILDRPGEPWWNLPSPPVERRGDDLEALRAALRESSARWRETVRRLARDVDASGAPSAYPFEVGRLQPLDDQRPVFILGAARSGTTALTEALRRAGFFAWAEGHLFSTLPFLLGAIKRTWDHQMALQGGRVSDHASAYLDEYQLLNQTIASYQQVYGAAAAGRRWVDKTPDYPSVALAPLLRHLYPRAVFVFLHRHPLKMVASRRRFFEGAEPIEVALQAWMAALVAWQEVRAGLDGFEEVAQADLSLRTDEVVARLARRLEISADGAARMADYLRSQRPLSTGSSADAGQLCLEDLDWADDLKHTCVELCEPLAQAWGYRLRR
jgi:hypothetical protein